MDDAMRIAVLATVELATKAALGDNVTLDRVPPRLMPLAHDVMDAVRETMRRVDRAPRC